MSALRPETSVSADTVGSFSRTRVSELTRSPLNSGRSSRWSTTTISQRCSEAFSETRSGSCARRPSAALVCPASGPPAGPFQPPREVLELT